MKLKSKLLEIENQFINNDIVEDFTQKQGLQGLRQLKETGKINDTYYFKNFNGGYVSFTFELDSIKSLSNNNLSSLSYSVKKTDLKSIEGIVFDKLNINKKYLTKQGGLENFIPVVEIVFNPDLPTGLFEYRNVKYFNTFTSTDYIKISSNIEKKERLDSLSEENMKLFFPNTYAYLMNLCENNWEYTDKFINWISAHLHEKEKLGTAWIFKGVQGGGKDTLKVKYLERLYGSSQVKAIDNNAVLNKFNNILVNSMAVVLNESSLSSKESNKISSILKNWVTEKDLLIEGKGIDSVNKPTYFSFLVFSNNLTPIPIELGDRRFNVMQTAKPMKAVAEEDLGISLTEFRGNLDKEAHEFCLYISSLNFDIEAARTAILNKTKRSVQQGSQKRPNLFYNIISNRKPSELRMLYLELSELIIQEGLADTEGESRFLIDSELERLKNFIKYILSGYIPVSDLSHFLILYVSSSSEKMSPQAASRMLTTFFGNTIKKRLNKSDSGSTRVKSIGESLDITLLNNIVAESEEDLDSELNSLVVLKEEEIGIAEAFNISKEELIDIKKAKSNGEKTSEEALLEIPLNWSITFKSFEDKSFILENKDNYVESFKLENFSFDKNVLTFKASEKNYNDFVDSLKPIVDLNIAA